MFTQYFGMKFNPFSKEIPSDNLYESNDFKELESRLKYLQKTRGIGLVIGEPGTGKSTALRRYVSSLNRSLYKPCYMALSTLTVMDFYHSLAQMLGEVPAHRKIKMFNQIQDAINSLYYDQKITPILIMDEIHMATSGILEDLRLLLNFRMDSANPYILILCGQPPIRNRLAMNANLPLRQRISVRYMMKGLNKGEVPEYIKTRLKAAGTREDIFLPETMKLIHANTGGFTRPINNLATASLIYAASVKKDYVDEEVIFQAQKELN
jgi:type II secretory pathway predicted ATPase ExeA